MERLSVFCGRDDSIRKCQISISRPRNSNDAYYLTSYQSNYTMQQQVSRFLERATYGPRRIDLSSWNMEINIEEGMAQWVKDQINNKVCRLALNCECFEVIYGILNIKLIFSINFRAWRRIENIFVSVSTHEWLKRTKLEFQDPEHAKETQDGDGLHLQITMHRWVT